MKNTLFNKIFSSGVQAISVQVLGGVFFLVIAAYLPKDSFGIITWGNGVALVLTVALSYGMDHVVLRRIAASDSSDWAAAAYLFHAAVTSLLAFIVLFTLKFIPGLSADERLVFLPWFFLSQAFIFIGNPLKQLLNAKHQFAPYALISVLSNAGKLITALLLIYSNTISLRATVTILIIFSASELAALLLYLIYKKGFSLWFKKVAYFKLLKEATPQYVAALFDAIQARADVILVGIICTKAITAEYGFAYRIYEIAKLPITVIIYLIMPRFARMLNFNSRLDDTQKQQVQKLFVLEMFFAMMIPLALCIIWSPLLDAVFNKKFGTANQLQFSLLSLSIPIHFYINILWILGFSAKKYTGISKIIAITTIINIICNLVLIPVWGGEGAACAYLITSILQLLGYHKLIRTHLMNFSSTSFIIFFITGLVAYFAATLFISNVIVQLAIALGLYITIALISGRVQKSHITVIKSFLKQ